MRGLHRGLGSTLRGVRWKLKRNVESGTSTRKDRSKPAQKPLKSCLKNRSKITARNERFFKQDLSGLSGFSKKNRPNRSNLAGKPLKPLKSLAVFERDFDPGDQIQVRMIKATFSVTFHVELHQNVHRLITDFTCRNRNSFHKICMQPNAGVHRRPT